MKNILIMNLANKKIGIFGLGKTGIASFEYLKNNNADLICSDDNPRAIQAFAEQFPGHSLDINDPKWQKLDYILVSPGIGLHYPQQHAIAKIAQEHNIKIISDNQILFEHNRLSTFIAITGTNGKSTTTALTHWIMADKNFAVGGNIGAPCLGLTSCDGYVLELSSYQLDLLNGFKPQYAAITNITPDHLDRYPSMQHYIASKLSIASNMDFADHLVINIDDEILFSQHFNNTNVISISLESPLADIYNANGKLVDNIKQKTYNLQQPKSLQGRHNLHNMLSAYALCSAYGIASEQILAKISTFPGIAHRLEFVRKIGNISFYNDSKATNAQAASKALVSLDNIFWLVGGLQKAGGISSIANFLGSVRKAYFFGQDAKTLADSVHIDKIICNSMQEAFVMATNDAKIFAKTSNVLLSPACASFDQFKNFEERGNIFIQLVNQL